VLNHSAESRQLNGNLVSPWHKSCELVSAPLVANCSLASTNGSRVCQCDCRARQHSSSGVHDCSADRPHRTLTERRESDTPPQYRQTRDIPDVKVSTHQSSRSSHSDKAILAVIL